MINDIGVMFDFYGVEVCCVIIVCELVGVFGGYGIKVDNCYLNFIVDYMICGGDFIVFSCMGLCGNVSFFIKMSFEMMFGFFKDVVLDGDWDDFMILSGRFVMGKFGWVGMGGFDVLM